MGVYERLDVPTVVNGVGTKTRISGTLMREEAADAMRNAADQFARISDLQARASELISEATGSEAGYVTSGAAAGLALSVAACIAGDDLGTMARLPDTEGIAIEVVMPRTHRNGYDHALRVGGADLVDVGNSDYDLGSGSKNVELWEIEAAITEDTVAVAYMAKPHTQPPLEDVVAVAHDHDVPVIVDAAAELPPKSNLSKYTDAGADLVTFSGGKAIRGPQTTGILAGREDLIRSAALQHIDMHAVEDVWVSPGDLFDVDDLAGVPRQGLGRPMKVGKEEIVGLLTALELFVEEDETAVLSTWHERAERIAEGLREADGLDVSLVGASKNDAITSLSVTVDKDRAEQSATDVVRGLRTEDPRVYVGADDVRDGRFTVNPMCLSDDDADYLVERVLSYVK